MPTFGDACATDGDFCDHMTLRMPTCWGAVRYGWLLLMPHDTTDEQSLGCRVLLMTTLGRGALHMNTIFGKKNIDPRERIQLV